MDLPRAIRMGIYAGLFLLCAGPAWYAGKPIPRWRKLLIFFFGALFIGAMADYT